MSRQIPSSLYPMMLVADRYQGIYSGGEWLAIANADALEDGIERAAWVLRHGPHDNDLAASDFWATAPDWIAAGATFDLAVDALLARAAIAA